MSEQNKEQKQNEENGTGDFCKACGIYVMKPKVCSSCRIAKYCSKECQLECWKEKGHSFLCSSQVHIQNCKGAGFGVVALKDIAVGEEVLCEKPLVRFDEGEDLNEKLTAKKRRLLWQMHDAFNYDGKKSIGGIARTNGLPTSESQGLFLLALIMHAMGLRMLGTFGGRI